MYEVISQQAITPEQSQRFLGERVTCRYCATSSQTAFGKRTNAHTFPRALGNQVLFSLDECKSCNKNFSTYEDALIKAIGPFLTLGGVAGRNGVRQTGRSNSRSTIRHNIEDGQRRLSIKSEGNPDNVLSACPQSGKVRLRIPIIGDKFVPLYAYKALLKTALALLPESEIDNFQTAINSLHNLEQPPFPGPLQVGFSYSYIGNAPPVLAGTLLRRKEEKAKIPYTMFIFVAGSVCFQIWVRSDNMDEHVPNLGKLGVMWTSQLSKPEGGYLPIRYSDPLQFDWSELSPRLQPFEAFELVFDPCTTKGEFTPIRRD